MTIRLYFTNTYLYNAVAKITKISKDSNGYFLRLDKTIFHPQGGGQPSDIGTINGIKVSRAINDKTEDDINHYIEDVTGLLEGQEVQLEVDKDKRLEHAVLHSTGHLLAGILNKFGLMEQTGAHHFPGECRVEFRTKSSETTPSAEDIQKAAIAAIKSNSKMYLDHSSGERHFVVSGFSDIRCGGTHLSSTGEIQDFMVKGIKIKSGVMKISYGCTYNYGLHPKSTSAYAQKPLSMAGYLSKSSIYSSSKPSSADVVETSQYDLIKTNQRKIKQTLDVLSAKLVSFKAHPNKDRMAQELQEMEEALQRIQKEYDEDEVVISSMQL